MMTMLTTPGTCRETATAIAISLGAAMLLATGTAHAQCNPYSPGSLPPNPDGTSIDSIAASGTWVAVAVGFPPLGPYYAQFIDTSDPAAPAVSNLSLYGRVEVSGTLAFVTNNFSSLNVVDLEHPDGPTVIGNVDLPHSSFDLAASGDTVYLASLSGLIVVDVADPTAPEIVGTLDTAGFGRLEHSNGFVYARDTSTLSVVDVSNPAAPAVVGDIEIEAHSDYLAVTGSTVYVRGESPTTLFVVDASSPTEPVIATTLDVDVGVGVLALAGSFLYLASDVLTIVDVSVPLTPVSIGTYQYEITQASHIAASGSRVYLGGLGLEMVDTSSCASGACCIGGACLIAPVAADCDAAAGTYLGPGTTCDAAECSFSFDSCAFAMDVAAGSIEFDTAGATTDGPPLPPECNDGFGTAFENDIWLRYTPAQTGTLNISTCNQADRFTRIAVYGGDCGALELIGCDGDGTLCDGLTAVLEVPVEAGVPVRIRVGAYTDQAVTGTLTLTELTCPSDLDGNGVVDVGDLIQVILDWGPCDL